MQLCVVLKVSDNTKLGLVAEEKLFSSPGAAATPSVTSLCNFQKVPLASVEAWLRQ